MVEETSQETLKILLCSDTHEAWTDLDKLCAKEKSDFDYVFLSGDQANGHNRINQVNDSEANKAMEVSNKRFVETLGTLVKQGGKVIYIPGNHDAEILYKPD